MKSEPSGCPGSKYSTAPSGAPCDPARIRRGGGLVAWGCGAGIGDSCDTLTFELESNVVPPPGFECGSADAGIRQCRWIFDHDSSRGGYIDNAALEAACAITTQLPMREVLCAVHGS
jgi:hypothetical protein